MQPMSFSAKLSLGFCLLLCLALLAFFAAGRGSLRSGLLKETEQHAVRNLNLVAWMVEEHGPFTDLQEFDAWLTRLGERLGCRITFIDQGRVLADSGVVYGKLPELEDHGSRPEVVRAEEQGLGLDLRRSSTLKRDLLYVASPLEAVSGLPAGVLRLAVPLSDIQEQYLRLAGPLGGIFFGTLAAGVLFALLLSRALVRSIGELSAAAKAIGGGEYGLRIRDYPGREFKPLAEALNGMAAAVQETVNDLEEGRRRIETLFEAMSDGVLVLDGQGCVESWNRALNDLYPDLSRAAGRHLIEALPEPELHGVVTRLLKSGAASKGQLVKCDAPGGRHLDVRVERFTGQDGHAKLLLVFRDVTEEKRLEVVRRDFVTNISHELKTPITSILGYSETLLDLQAQDDAESRKQSRRFLEVIQRNAAHMQGMVQRLMDLCRAERPQAGQAPRPVDAGPPLERALATLEPLLRNKGVRVLQPDAVAGQTVLADEEGLEIVFRNLLENALKFGPEGQTVTINARKEGAQVLIGIEDQGPGVPKAHQERIFERFYRINGENTKDGSAGLGLSICRNQVKRWGGGIRVESPAQPEEASAPGTRFVLTLNTA